LSAADGHPTRLKRSQHGIHPENVDSGAVEVVTRLQDAGFAAYLVGGCVRDLLLGHEPKDFDVATSATPEEVRELFRRSRLVGRRFRIAHVRVGRDVIEVSTFRSGTSAEEDDERSHSEEGMILRDNVYGTIEEDAFRRDFTINALYYDPTSREVIDYVGGLDDLEHRRLHFIGDTVRRLREDPVRAIRAVRFQAKIGFDVDPAITRALPETAEAITAIPPARLFDEVLKLLLSGYGAQAWSLLADTPLRAALFPCVDPHDPLIGLAMRNTDERIGEGKPVTPGFMLAVLLWRDYQARLGEHEASAKPAEARFLAASDALAAQQRILSVPRRFSQFVRDVWSLQERLVLRRPRSIGRLLQHPRFRAAYDFLLLRAETGEPVRDEADWWTEYQDADSEARRRLTDALTTREPKRRRRKRRRKGSSGGEADPVDCS